MNGMTFSRRQALAMGTAAAGALFPFIAACAGAGGRQRRKEEDPCLRRNAAGDRHRHGADLRIPSGRQGERHHGGTRRRAAELVKGGGSLVDTAPSYGAAEERIGILLEQLGIRDRIFLATKARVDGAAGTIASFEQSLKLLRTNRVELMQLHNPKESEPGPRALSRVQEAGPRQVYRFLLVLRSRLRRCRGCAEEAEARFLPDRLFDGGSQFGRAAHSPPRWISAQRFSPTCRSAAAGSSRRCAASRCRKWATRNWA